MTAIVLPLGERKQRALLSLTTPGSSTELCSTGALPVQLLFLGFESISSLEDILDPQVDSRDCCAQVVRYRGRAAVPLPEVFGGFSKVFFVQPQTFELYGRVQVIAIRLLMRLSLRVPLLDLVHVIGTALITRKQAMLLCTGTA